MQKKDDLWLSVICSWSPSRRRKAEVDSPVLQEDLDRMVPICGALAPFIVQPANVIGRDEKTRCYWMFVLVRESQSWPLLFTLPAGQTKTKVQQSVCWLSNIQMSLRLITLIKQKHLITSNSVTVMTEGPFNVWYCSIRSNRSING